MDDVARLPEPERRELFSETAAKMDLRPGLIEKDFWVCWILKQIFSTEVFESHFLFKGGTTLSKVFGVIERFSEDIDLAVDWEMLGFVGERNPLADISTTKRTKLLGEMLETCREYIATDFAETFRNRIAEKLPTSPPWQLAVDEDSREVVNFYYPAVTETVSYIQPAVRLELGTHAEFIPNDHYSIKPYAADHFAEIFKDAQCNVQAIKAERTFWEKVTILHQEHFRTAERDAPTRMSRHYYDVFMMSARREIRRVALDDPDLLARVVRHKKHFFPRAWARYDLAVPASLQLQPSSDWIEFLHRDYESMRIMFFGVVPSFEDVLAGISELEQAIRKMPQT